MNDITFLTEQGENLLISGESEKIRESILKAKYAGITHPVIVINIGNTGFLKMLTYIENQGYQAVVPRKGLPSLPEEDVLNFIVDILTINKREDLADSALKYCRLVESVKSFQLMRPSEFKIDWLLELSDSSAFQSMIDDLYQGGRISQNVRLKLFSKYAESCQEGSPMILENILFFQLGLTHLRLNAQGLSNKQVCVFDISSQLNSHTVKILYRTIALALSALAPTDIILFENRTSSKDYIDEMVRFLIDYGHKVTFLTEDLFSKRNDGQISNLLSCFDKRSFSRHDLGSAQKIEGIFGKTQVYRKQYGKMTDKRWRNATFFEHLIGLDHMDTTQNILTDEYRFHAIDIEKMADNMAVCYDRRTGHSDYFSI